MTAGDVLFFAVMGVVMLIVVAEAFRDEGWND